MNNRLIWRVGFAIAVVAVGMLMAARAYSDNDDSAQSSAATESAMQAETTSTETAPQAAATTETTAMTTPTEAAPWTVSLAAGGPAPAESAQTLPGGYKDGPAQEAAFDKPVGMAVAADGSVYIADSGNHRIRRLTLDGMVETFAGSGQEGTSDGPALEATFRTPVDVAVGPDGTVYVVDSVAGQIRSISNGEVRTVAGIDLIQCQELPKLTPDRGDCPPQGSAPFRDGPGATALFHQPSGVAVASNGEVYVADSSNQVIRKIDMAGTVSTWAGEKGHPGNDDGPRLEARFFFPAKLVIKEGGTFYLTEGNRVREIGPDGIVSTLAGSRAEGMNSAGFADGQGNDAMMKGVSGIALMKAGSLALADTGNQRIRLVTASGAVTTIAGKGGQGFALGPGDEAQFSLPVGIVELPDGSLLVSDYNLNRIFRVTR